jgi:hypothetical protein
MTPFEGGLLVPDGNTCALLDRKLRLPYHQPFCNTTPCFPCATWVGETGTEFLFIFGGAPKRMRFVMKIVPINMIIYTKNRLIRLLV